MKRSFRSIAEEDARDARMSPHHTKESLAADLKEQRPTWRPMIGSGATIAERPPIGQILAAIDTQIAGLVDSFTDRIGPTKGKISNEKIRLEVVCLRAARQIVLEAV